MGPTTIGAPCRPEQTKRHSLDLSKHQNFCPVPKNAGTSKQDVMICKRHQNWISKDSAYGRKMILQNANGCVLPSRPITSPSPSLPTTSTVREWLDSSTTKPFTSLQIFNFWIFKIKKKEGNQGRSLSGTLLTINRPNAEYARNEASTGDEIIRLPWKSINSGHTLGS